MTYPPLTDDEIQTLRTMPKLISNPNAQFRKQYKYERKEFIVKGENGHNFKIFLRQNIMPDMHDDFSCGLSYCSKTGVDLVLTRYNGGNHPHFNKIEKRRWLTGNHIHLATERYIAAGFKPEHFAERTDRFVGLSGALHCLVIDCNVSGLVTESDVTSQISMF